MSVCMLLLLGFVLQIHVVDQPLVGLARLVECREGLDGPLQAGYRYLGFLADDDRQPQLSR